MYYAATTEEDTLHLMKIMQCFKERNLKFSSTQVVVIDKDFAEWKMLTQEFPNAVVLFCQWHVLKVYFKQLNDAGVEKAQHEVARNAIRNVMYDYNINKQQLFDATNAEFRKYFLENWESCVEMWAAFKRDQYMHFGNTTNNRLESHNQKLKDVTSCTSTLSEMFNNVVLFAQMCESEYKYSTFNEEFKVMKSSYHQSIEGCSEVEV